MVEVSSEEGMIAGYRKKTLMTVLIAVVLVGAAFYAGAKYEKNKLSRLGLLKNGTSETQVQGKKKGKTSVVTTTTQKFADQEYAKGAYLISGPTLSTDAKKALTGFTMSQKTLPNGETSILLKAQKPSYHDQAYTLKAGEQLYFIEKFLQDDVNGVENNIGDDSAVVVNAEGNVVQGPADWSK